MISFIDYKNDHHYYRNKAAPKHVYQWLFQSYVVLTETSKMSLFIYKIYKLKCSLEFYMIKNELDLISRNFGRGYKDIYQNETIIMECINFTIKDVITLLINGLQTGFEYINLHDDNF